MSDIKDYTEFIREFELILQCCVCLETANNLRSSNKLLQCSYAGHLICQKCYAQMGNARKCPVCQQLCKFNPSVTLDKCSAWLKKINGKCEEPLSPSPAPQPEVQIFSPPRPPSTPSSIIGDEGASVQRVSFVTSGGATRRVVEDDDFSSTSSDEPLTAAEGGSGVAATTAVATVPTIEQAQQVEQDGQSWSPLVYEFSPTSSSSEEEDMTEEDRLLWDRCWNTSMTIFSRYRHRIQGRHQSSEAATNMFWRPNSVLSTFPCLSSECLECFDSANEVGDHMAYAHCRAVVGYRYLNDERTRYEYTMPPFNPSARFDLYRLAAINNFELFALVHFDLNCLDTWGLLLLTRGCLLFSRRLTYFAEVRDEDEVIYFTSICVPVRTLTEGTVRSEIPLSLVAGVDTTNIATKQLHLVVVIGNEPNSYISRSNRV